LLLSVSYVLMGIRWICE